MNSARELHMRTIHELAAEIGRTKIEKARAALGAMVQPARRQWMRSELAERLGDIEPVADPRATLQWSKKMPEATVDGITIQVEPDVTVPLLLFRPQTKGSGLAPVVVGTAEGGKEAFLAERSEQIQKLLRAGIAVCLADVRGTGETSPDFRRDPDSDESMQAVNEHMLGETLLGRRLKDLRTVLGYLAKRDDLDGKRVALWGESLIPVNENIRWDELPLWQVGPQIQHQGEPLGGLLALLGALYDDNVRAVAVRGGLVSYASILDDAFAYVPADVTVPGFLEAGDLADVEAMLAPTPLLLEDLIDAKNRLVPENAVRAELEPLMRRYGIERANVSVRSGKDMSQAAEWLKEQLSQ